jgi:hypothetical protein
MSPTGDFGPVTRMPPPSATIRAMKLK